MQIQSQVKPKLQMFVSNRSIVVRSARSGQAIRFEKDTPMGVPRIMHDEVMEKGILPVDADVEKVVAAVSEQKKMVLAPDDQMEREDALLAAMKAIVDGNDSKNFTGAGCPNAKAVSMALGWHVDQKDVRTVWEKHRVTLTESESAGQPPIPVKKAKE